MNEYNGPDFTTLDERIQTGLTEYLEGYGVNEHLAAFVECMSLDKDQRLYMRWLESVKSFIGN
jgi:complement component 1 Q subcomponent-binding protein, mitochondrial